MEKYIKVVLPPRPTLPPPPACGPVSIWKRRYLPLGVKTFPPPITDNRPPITGKNTHRITRVTPRGIPLPKARNARKKHPLPLLPRNQEKQNTKKKAAAGVVPTTTFPALPVGGHPMNMN